MKTDQEKKPLLVYNASAGSGKTFTLAKIYIDMLIRNPMSYEHILAVTFTNKATAEMMERIVSDLHEIASCDVSNDSREKLLQRQREMLGLDKDDTSRDSEIVANCKTAMTLILNNYSQFCVSTIDSFVQRVIRAFAFENGLASNYGIELNTDEIIDAATDTVMQNLRVDKDLRDLVLRFVTQRMDDEGKWNIDGEIRHLAKDITHDDGRVFAETMNLKRSQQLMDLAKTRKSEMTKVLEDIIAHYSDSCGNAEADRFVSKSRSMKFSLLKLCREYLRKDVDLKSVIEKVSRWNKESKGWNEPSPDEFDIPFATFKDLWFKALRPYNTAVEILSHGYVIGLLSYIADAMNEWSKANHKLSISNSNKMLQDLIEGSSVPFIYEKIGSRYSHIMIDEFQDTSDVDWSNFQPLVANCLDTSSDCLIVGDVKQAIYRWRNSDWHTLANIDKDEKVGAYVKKESLDTNWRSSRNIVNFNNVFIKKLCASMNDDSIDSNSIESVYKSFEQQVAPNIQKSAVEGYVKVCMTGANRGNANEEIHRQVYETIIDLKETYNYSLKNICILVRSGSEGSNTMNYLASKGVPVISSDSLLVCNSPVVKAIICALKYLCDRRDKISLFSFVAVCNPDNDLAEVSQWWKNGDSIESISSEILSFSGRGLLETVNSIIGLIPLAIVERDFIFVEAFIDHVRSYMINSYVNIADFLVYIDKKKNDMKIAAPNDQDAVQIMTIHKSKGLEFPVVLMPYADWEIDKPNKYIWVKDLPAPYNQLGFDRLPVVYNQRLLDTDFVDSYLHEHTMNYIDNLNLMYVAATRAKDVLVLWGANNNKVNIGQYTLRALSSMTDGDKKNGFGGMDVSYVDFEGNVIENGSADKDTFAVYTCGKLSRVSESGKKSSQTVSIAPYELHEWNGKVSVTEQKGVPDKSMRENSIRLGNILHGIMEHIVSPSDIDSAVDSANLDGALTSRFASYFKRSLHHRMTADPLVREWFDVSAQQILAEVTFYSAGAEYRPDRIVRLKDGRTVIVDYKFGKKPDPDSQEQLKTYKSLLTEAGFSNVEAYVWYYRMNKIEKIN